jgi:hypothetical protein
MRPSGIGDIAVTHRPAGLAGHDLGQQHRDHDV